MIIPYLRTVSKDTHTPLSHIRL